MAAVGLGESLCRTTNRSPFFSSGTPATTNVCSVDAGQFVQLLLDLDVRNHLAADLAEAAEAVGDLQEAVLVNGGDVAGDIPAVAQDFGGLLRSAEVALHDVGAAHEQQAGLADRHRLRRSPGPRCGR